jgi:hypothetical protein
MRYIIPYQEQHGSCPARSGLARERGARASSGQIESPPQRLGRAWPGHPRDAARGSPAKPGEDELGCSNLNGFGLKALQSFRRKPAA